MYNFTLYITLRCFVARHLLSRIYALSSVKFLGLKLRLCKKRDEVWVDEDDLEVDEDDVEVDEDDVEVDEDVNWNLGLSSS